MPRLRRLRLKLGLGLGLRPRLGLKIMLLVTSWPIPHGCLGWLSSAALQLKEKYSAMAWKEYNLQ